MRVSALWRNRREILINKGESKREGVEGEEKENRMWKRRRRERRIQRGKGRSSRERTNLLASVEAVFSLVALSAGR